MKKLTRDEFSKLVDSSMRNGATFTPKQINKLSDDYHEAGRVFNYMKSQLKLPVELLGYDHEERPYYGYLPSALAELTEDESSVKQAQANRLRQERNGRLANNVELAIKEIGLDVVNDIVKTAILNEVFCPR